MGIGLEFGFTSKVDVYDIGSAQTYTFEEDSDSASLGMLMATNVLAAIVYEGGKPRVLLDAIPGMILSPRSQYRIVSKFDTYTSVTVGQIIDEDTIQGYDMDCI